MAAMTYAPPRSVVGFLMNEQFIDLILGPVGSTKTTAGIMKIAYHAKQMAPCFDGIRRSRAIWVRNTREQLKDTSMPDFLHWFPDGIAGTLMKTDYKFILRFDDVECEVLFRGLDDSNDVRRLLSLQASFGILDEFREIRQDIFEALQGRLGRYPSKLHNGRGCVTDAGTENKHLWGMSNPPDADSFWERFCSEPPENANVVIQPSGQSAEADWTEFLPDGYYDNLAKGKTQDWIDVYIHAKFGRSLAGKPVFPAFRTDFHVAKTTLTPIRSDARPLIVGMDFGLNPSCTINQLDYHGRFLTYDALTSDNMGLTRFIQTILKPLLAQKYAGMKAVIVGDPAGVQRAQTDEKSCYDILRMNGFKAVPARTNNIVARIAAVDYFFAGQVEGGPKRLIDPGCRPLLKAYRGGYRYKIKKSGETEDTPEKNDSSHIADADQYACLHGGGGFDPSTINAGRRVVHPASSKGWT